ncbi:MAG: hypothetical protein M1438_03135 [Deltaproteobacteria bacterium]|nr:hypothetical protein [Deltaproteobacteria bacterium]
MLHARKSYMRIQDPLSEAEGGIGVNEPVFLLRAKDKVAAAVVRAWAFAASAAGADQDIVESALRQAEAMEAWEPKQIPDMPPGDAS